MFSLENIVVLTFFTFLHFQICEIFFHILMTSSILDGQYSYTWTNWRYISSCLFNCYVFIYSISSLRMVAAWVSFIDCYEIYVIKPNNVYCSFQLSVDLQVIRSTSKISNVLISTNGDLFRSSTGFCRWCFRFAVATQTFVSDTFIASVASCVLCIGWIVC